MGEYHTPYWRSDRTNEQLIAHDRHNDARQVLWAVQPNAREIGQDDAVINLEMTEITHTMAEERQAAEKGSFKMLLKDGPQRFRHRTLLAMGGQMMQQLSGINLITYVCSSSSFWLSI